MDKNRYWIAQGRSLEIFREWEASVRDYRAEVLKIAEEVTGVSKYNQTLNHVFHSFPSQEGKAPPPGLRVLHGQPAHWVLDYRTKAGKALRERMPDPTKARADKLRAALWGNPYVILARDPYFRLVKKEGSIEVLQDGTVVLGHSEKMMVDPPDAKPISRALTASSSTKVQRRKTAPKL